MSEKTKFTEGPWEANFSSQGIYSIMKKWPSKEYPDNQNVFEVQTISLIRPFDELSECDLPNGKLLAAAPELLEALRYACQWMESDASFRGYNASDLKPYCQAQEIIKKATS